MSINLCKCSTISTSRRSTQAIQSSVDSFEACIATETVLKSDEAIKRKKIKYCIRLMDATKCSFGSISRVIIIKNPEKSKWTEKHRTNNGNNNQIHNRTCCILYPGNFF